MASIASEEGIMLAGQGCRLFSWYSNCGHAKSETLKMKVLNRPSLPDFGVTDRLTTGVILCQIRTSYNGMGKPAMAFYSEH